MRICAISDLHGLLPELEPCDLVLIAGDISPLSIQQNIPLMDSWLFNKFIPWINNLDCGNVILVAGNHDFWFERASESSILLLQSGTNFKLRYLCNQLYYIAKDDGSNIKIFGTPYCHRFGNWPFMKTDDILIEKFKEIPKNLDILISHDPPYGICDIDCILENMIPDHVGGTVLADRILEIKPSMVICGHIHSGEHNPTLIGKTTYVNVSLLNESYKYKYKPYYFEL